MSSFISRSAVLAFARLMNQALALVGPLILVRLLQIAEYGQYRQFTVTAMFVVALAGFAVSNNLNYLVARSPEHEAANVSNACLLMFISALAGALAVAVGHALFVPEEIVAAWPWLALYILLALNLEVPVSYWLAHGRSDKVLVYTLVLTAMRLGAVTGAAWLSGNILTIFITMVCVEALRLAAVYLWLRRRQLLRFRWEPEAFREQLRLVTPLGTGSVLNKLNEHIGKVVVGNNMGPAPLAIYTTAAYQVPVVGIVQQTLVDVVFPDMVKRSRQDPLEGLRLWKRANVLIFSAILPAWALLTYFADPLVRLLFTDAYAEATPYFQVFLLLMLRQSFQFSTPLRCVEDNASFARSNAIALALNVGLILALMPRYGLWGPTLGLVLGQLWIPFYLGRKVIQRFAIPASQLCEWPKLALTVLATALAFAVMYLALSVLPHSFGGIAAGLALFGVVYALCARLFLHDEYRYVMKEFSRRSRNKGRGACQNA